MRDYYSVNGIDPITAMENGLVSREQYIGFLKGNVMKYVVRCEYKGDVLSDLDKAKDYLEILYDFFKCEKTKREYIASHDFVEWNPDCSCSGEFEWSDDLEKKKMIHDIATKLNSKEENGYYE